MRVTAQFTRIAHATASWMRSRLVGGGAARLAAPAAATANPAATRFAGARVLATLASFGRGVVGRPSSAQVGAEVRSSSAPAVHRTSPGVVVAASAVRARPVATHRQTARAFAPAGSRIGAGNVTCGVLNSDGSRCINSDGSRAVSVKRS